MVFILDGSSVIGEHVRSNLLFHLFQAFDLTESSHKSDLFVSENIFIPWCVCNMLPSNLNTMYLPEFWFPYRVISCEMEEQKIGKTTFPLGAYYREGVGGGCLGHGTCTRW